MQNSRIVKILKTFSREELKELERFIASPYFSRERNLTPFLKTIKSFYPEFDQKRFTNEHIFLKLFPSKKFDNKNSVNILKTLSHELFKLCKEFLIYSDFSNDENSKNFYLLNKLRQKKLYSEYEKSYKNALDTHSKSNGASINDFIDKYFLLYTFNEYCVETSDYKGAFETIAGLDEIACTIGLIRAYRSFEFKYLAQTGYNLQSAVNFSESVIKNMDSVKLIKEMKKNNDKYYPYIALNYMFYMISEYPDVDKYYFEFKKLVYENLNLFGHTEKYILFSRLASYCSMVSKERPTEKFRREHFEIFSQSIKLGVYKYSDKDDFSIHHFRNIVLNALEVNELDWLENFICKYSVELAPEDRANMKHYSLAHLNYARKEYEKALANILKIKINFIYYKLDLKNLMFKIYFDMNLFESALSILESMRQYITTGKELTPSRKLKSKNFIKFAKGLLKIKSASSKISSDYLLNKIRNDESIGSKEWLITKAMELIQKSTGFHLFCMSIGLTIL